MTGDGNDTRASGVERRDLEYWSEQAEAALDQMGHDAVTSPRENADDVAIVVRDVDTREEREDLIDELERRGFEVKPSDESVVLVDASANRFDHELRADGGGADGPDRWKCPDCGRIVVDPGAPIAACSCGSERVQIREWPGQDDDWSPPEWPADSEYSPESREVETEIEYKPWKGTHPDGGER